MIKKHTRKLRLIITGTIGSLLFKLVHRKGFDPTNTIVIFGSIRSGSTWLAEVISSLDGHLQVFEPLHRVYVPEITDHISEENKYVAPDQEWPAGRELFSKILSGKVINGWTMSQAPLFKIPVARRLVVKLVRGNLLLDWFARNVPSLPPILVIRHPCSVIASQLDKGWLSYKSALLDNAYFDKWPDVKSRCHRLSEPEELAALAWCLRYHAPLMSSKPYPFVLVSYEKLVRDGERELKRIFDVLNIPLGKKAIEHLYIPSDTATNSSEIVSGKDPLSGWKGKLTDKQVENIMSVLSIFEMDFYSTALVPDYEKLESFGVSP